VRDAAFTGLGAISFILFITTDAYAAPWSFGVMSDTQWIGTAGTADNANSVSVSIVNQINTQMINAGVAFVVQVGDLTDNGTAAALATRATAAQSLANAGIGFFPLRGNHEYTTGAVSPTVAAFPQMQGTSNTFGATNFQLASRAGLNSLSYSFDYNNAQFVLLDQYPTSGSISSTNATNISSQLGWLNTTLANDTSQQSFVFSHKNLIGGNHVDTLFGTSPASDPATQNQFLNTLDTNGVQYYLSGHDHMYQRSVITSPDGTSQVTQIIDGSDSNKFYIPAGDAENYGTGANAGKTNDQRYDTPARQTILAQDLYHVGYTIFTIDGADVTGRYYEADVGATNVGGEYLITSTPTMTFYLADTFSSSVPEPASLGLFVPALGLLGVARRRFSVSKR
jgi:hypothetical protein